MIRFERRQQDYCTNLTLYEQPVTALLDDQEYYPQYGLSEIFTGMETLPLPMLVQTLVGDRLKPTSILPEGYFYEQIQDAPRKAGALIEMSIDAHISDTNDFEGGTLQLLNNALCTTVIITKGEKGGFDGMSEEQTIAIRMNEALLAQQILGNQLAYLSPLDGGTFIDGALLSQLTMLKDAIKNDVRARKPDVVIIHSDQLDHLDHVATYHATVRALRELFQEENFKKPAVYIREPEFLFPSGTAEQYEMLSNSLHNWSLGRRSKYAQQKYRERPKLETSDFIVDITSVKQKKIAALLAHETQMKRHPNSEELKDYVTRIPARMLVQGSRLAKHGEKKWAEGFRQLHIHGVTSSENKLAFYLPNGSMYRLRKIG